MIYIGIDPGVSGGIAWLGDNGQVNAQKTPTDDGNLLDVFYDLRRVDPQLSAVVERVSGGNFAGRRSGATSAFTFGGSYARLRMALTATEIPYSLVLPKLWQKWEGVVFPADLDYRDRKAFTKQIAARRFPSISVTHATADALLLASFAQRLERARRHRSRRRK